MHKFTTAGKAGSLWRLLVSAVGACLISGIVLTAVDLERQDLSRRESESRFMLAAKAAPVMIWMSGIDKLRTYFSDHLARIHWALA